MKLFLILNKKNSGSLEAYDGMIVAAESKEDAVTIHPNEHDKGYAYNPVEKCFYYSYRDHNGELVSWRDRSWEIDDLTVKYLGEYIGEASEDIARGVVLTSYRGF